MHSTTPGAVLVIGIFVEVAVDVGGHIGVGAGHGVDRGGVVDRNPPPIQLPGWARCCRVAAFFRCGQRQRGCGKKRGRDGAFRATPETIKRGCRHNRQPLKLPTPPTRRRPSAYWALVVLASAGRVGINRRVGVHVHRHVRVSRIQVSRRSCQCQAFMSVVMVLINVHGVVGGFVAAASRHRQGRTSDQDKSTHSRLPNYCDLQRVTRVANRAHNSLKGNFPSRDFVTALQAVEKPEEIGL